MSVPYPREDAWLEELPGLIAGGPTESFQARWWERTVSSGGGGYGCIGILWRAIDPPMSSDQTEVALYRVDASPGDPPAVLVPVGGGALAHLGEGSADLAVRGHVAAGRALVLVLGADVVPCVGPARVPMWWRRRYRL